MSNKPVQPSPPEPREIIENNVHADGRLSSTVTDDECSGMDGAMQSVDRLITGLHMRKVHPGVIARRVCGEAGSSKGALRDEDLGACRETGQLFAVGLAMGVL